MFVRTMSSEPHNIGTKPGVVMQHHKPECHAEKLVDCVQCQGHRKGLYNQNVTVSVVSS